MKVEYLTILGRSYQDMVSWLDAVIIFDFHAKGGARK
jgi:hypothetical protein